MEGTGVGVFSTAAGVKPGPQRLSPGGQFLGWLELSFNSSLGCDRD